MEIIDIIEEFLSFVAFCKDASLLEQSEISSQNNSIFSETKQVMLEARNNVELLKAYWQIGKRIVEHEHF